MKLTSYITVADSILIAGLVALAAGLFVAMPQWVLSGGEDLEIRVENRLVGRYTLDENRVVEVSGPRGKTLVRIKDGRATVVASPCRDKICAGMGEVGREGGIIVCVPNRVVVEVGKGRSNGLDAVTR